MKTTLLIVLALAIAASLQAKDITWHKGSVVLTDRQVVVGEIARLSFDLLLYRGTAGEITSYPAHKVASFRYHDEAEDINRIFISISTRSGVVKTHKYYERVALGTISVLRIQQTFSDTIGETNPEGFDFYIEHDRIVCPLKKFRRKYFDQVTSELDNHLISHRHLDPNTRLGALSLIILYNQTSSVSSVASLN